MQFLDIKTLCEKVGGTRPVNPATIYRMVNRGQLPKPARVGGSSRWVEAEVTAALTAMVEARHGR